MQLFERSGQHLKGLNNNGGACRLRQSHLTDLRRHDDCFLDRGTSPDKVDNNDQESDDDKMHRGLYSTGVKKLGL